MEAVSCHPSGAEKFNVAPTFLENLFTPGKEGKLLTEFSITFDSDCTIISN